MDLPLGWATDLAVLCLGEAVAEDCGDHLVVRTSGNPGFHWGNFVLVSDAGAVDDAPRWVRRFCAEFPDAGHVSVGLVAEPAREPWEALGLAVESERVLVGVAPPAPTPVPPGYEVRPLTSPADWAQALAMDLAENEASGAHPTEGFRLFTQARVRARAATAQQGRAVFVGAFAGGELVASLGIVLCDDGARYQSVQTRADHRRRGLAGHLLGAAGGWAADRGAQRWVILTDPGSEAERLYRRLGFAPHSLSWQAHRPAPAELSPR